jgi:hypothetical protein
MRMTRFAVGALALVALSGAAASAGGPALAANAQDSAVAQSLYDDASKLMTEGKFTDACPKLEESQRLDPEQVTEFKLADCYEHVGRTASAWTTFLDLAEVSRKAGRPERERVARDRATQLEPKLTRLTVDVPADVRVAGLVVKRDGEVVGEGQYGVAVAVDPGKHVVEASAPGKKTWTDSRVVTGEGATSTLKVEALVVDPNASATAATTDHGVGPEPTGGEKKGSPLKTVGLVVGGLGIVGIGVGSVMGILAIGKNNDANNGHCDKTSNLCDSTGLGMRSDAVTFGNVSTVGFIAGGVLLAGGATLWLLAPSSSVQAAPAVGTSGGGIVVRGRF